MTRTPLFFAGSLLGAALSACGGGSDPAWAIDPIWIEPTAEGVHGFQTWQVYSARWEKKQSERTFVCTVVVELDGVESPCTDCQVAWTLTPTLLESDCAESVAGAATFVSLKRLSIGLPLDSGDVAHPGLTSQGFADYGFGWEVHGQTWPDAAANGGAADASWDGAQPFAFWPELAWPVGP